MAVRPAVHARLYQDFYSRQASRSELVRSLDEDSKALHHPVLSAHPKARQPSIVVKPEADQQETQPVCPSTTRETRFKPYFPGEKREDQRGSDGPRKAAPLTHREVSSLFELREEASLTARTAPKTLRKVDPPLLAYKPKFGISQLRKQAKPIIGKYYSQLTPVERTISYSSGCNVQKIIKTGKEMISYSDSKAMFSALSQPH